jgi:hypothetical protein
MHEPGTGLECDRARRTATVSRGRRWLATSRNMVRPPPGMIPRPGPRTTSVERLGELNIPAVLDSPRT